MSKDRVIGHSENPKKRNVLALGLTVIALSACTMLAIQNENPVVIDTPLQQRAGLQGVETPQPYSTLIIPTSSRPEGPVDTREPLPTFDLTSTPSLVRTPVPRPSPTDISPRIIHKEKDGVADLNDPDLMEQLRKNCDEYTSLIEKLDGQTNEDGKITAAISNEEMVQQNALETYFSKYVGTSVSVMFSEKTDIRTFRRFSQYVHLPEYTLRSEYFFEAIALASQLDEETTSLEQLKDDIKNQSSNWSEKQIKEAKEKKDIQEITVDWLRLQLTQKTWMDVCALVQQGLIGPIQK